MCLVFICATLGLVFFAFASVDLGSEGGGILSTSALDGSAVYGAPVPDSPPFADFLDGLRSLDILNPPELEEEDPSPVPWALASVLGFELLLEMPVPIGRAEGLAGTPLYACQ